MMETISPEALEAMSEEEAERKLAQMKADLERQLGKARRQWGYNVQLAEQRLAHATKELDRLEALRAELAPYKDTAGGQPHYQRVRLLYHVYAAVRELMLTQLQANRYNLGLLQAESLSPELAFRIPDEEPAYLLARSRLDLATALFHWMVNLDGIDMVLRATGARPAVTAKRLRGDAEHAKRGEALKAAMAADRPLAIHVSKLGTELQDALALIEWAKTNLQKAPQMPAAGQRAMFADADWAKLNGAATYLAGVAEQARQFSALAPHFAQPEAAQLPYAEVVWAEGGGTAPLAGGR
jgi:hypothetical protein